MPMTKILPASLFKSVSIAAWVPTLALLTVLTGCQTAAPLPERPPAQVAAVSFEKAVDFAVDDLLIQAQRLPEFQPAPPSIGSAFRKDQPAAKIRIVVDNAVDGSSGQQTVATRALDERLLSGVTARFPTFAVSPISAGDVALARFVLTTAVTSLDQGKDKSSNYRISLSLTDARNGIVVAQAAAQATAATVDITPTAFYRDSPSLVKDRTVEGQIRTAQTPPGTAADGVYMANLSVVALIAEGSRLYELGQYTEALAVYEVAAGRPDGKHLRVYNGLYLCNIQLGRADGAEQAFGRLVLLGLATNSLSVKFLFRPGSTDFWPDPKINGPYPMWLRVVAREGIAAKSCMTIIGHSSNTGGEAANDRLSLARAASIQKRLEAAAPEMSGRLQSSGLGFRENLIGTGTDDARDALDRRVEFRVRGC